LIDEADIFLEKRTENDIIRNAMVGIFLRLLEYHQGVLFLTTNRVRCFDPAFHSRISVALKYHALDKKAREQIWKTLLDAAKIEGIATDKLSDHNLNGRQIRTTIRLAQSLAVTAGEKMDLSHIEKTVSVTQQFETDLSTNE
jgi:SpoVK/Ycf46/Vps4 family AAA+-type ATPase